MTDPVLPFLTDLPVPNRMADGDAFRLIGGRQRWAWAHRNDRAAYAEWIRGHTVICVCDQPITRTAWTGSRARLDPLEEPEGTWTHDGGDRTTWDTPADHVTRPLLLDELGLSPPCAVHSPADDRRTWPDRYRSDPYEPPAGQRAVFGPALTGPFDTRGPLFDRIFNRLWRLFDR